MRILVYIFFMISSLTFVSEGYTAEQFDGTIPTDECSRFEMIKVLQERLRRGYKDDHDSDKERDADKILAKELGAAQLAIQISSYHEDNESDSLFDMLALELMNHIVKYLPFKDVVAFVSVNKSLNFLGIFLELDIDLSCQKGFMAIKEHRAHVMSAFPKILTIFPCVRSLSLVNVFAAPLSGAGGGVPGVALIGDNIIGNNIIAGGGGGGVNAVVYTGLIGNNIIAGGGGGGANAVYVIPNNSHELSLLRSRVLYFISFLTQLRALDLSNCGFSKEEWTDFASYIPHLRNIECKL